MSASCRAWIVAASIGAVEALKDQGVCRWNGALRSLNQYAKNNMRSYSQAMKLSAANSSSSAISNQIKKRSKEEKFRKVMELNCWGPNTCRF